MQVEYYFSSQNLAGDHFMRDQINADPGGWVELVLINSFHRMKRMGKPLNEARRASPSHRLASSPSAPPRAAPSIVGTIAATSTGVTCPPPLQPCVSC